MVDDANKMLVKSIGDMHHIAYYVKNKVSTTQIIDARPAPRFKGEVDEPRPGLRRGHVSGAKNIPFLDVIDENGCLKSDKELA